MRRALAAAALLALALPASAFAHASLLHESPSYKQELRRAPRSVTLSFDQTIESLPNAVEVLDQRGRNLALPARVSDGPEFEDHQGGFVRGERLGQPRQSTLGGLAADAAVDHGIVVAAHLEADLQQGHPALRHIEPVGGAEAVAHHQDGRRGGKGRDRTRQQHQQ